MENIKEPKKKKKVGILIAFLAFCFIVAMIRIVTVENNPSSTNSTGGKGSGDGSSLFSEAQAAYENGKLADGKVKVEQAIKKGDKPEYQELLDNINQAIANRKTELEGLFDIKDDKVENITFIKPMNTIYNNLIFYPYIGIKESKKYMKVRIGYQTPTNSEIMLAFSGIKVRANDTLKEVPFKILSKHSDIDVFGSGVTEHVDVSVDGDVETLLTSDIPASSEVLVRFDNINNENLDYILSPEQVQSIADILEYYSYLD